MKENPSLLFKKQTCEIIYQTKDYLLAVPLDRECAVFFNSYNCGRERARWCIGDRNDSSYWENFKKDNEIFALVYFTKRQPIFGRKFLVQYNTEAEIFELWLQENKAKYQMYANKIFNNFDTFSKIKRERKTRKYIEMYAKLFKLIRRELPARGNKSEET